MQRQYTSEKLSHCTNQTITFKRLILGLSPLINDIVRLRPQKTYIICEKGCLIYSCNELTAREHILVRLRFSETTLEAAYVDRCALFQVSLGCRWPSSIFMGKCLRSCRIVALNMRTSIQHYKKRSILLLLLLLLLLLQLLLLLLLLLFYYHYYSIYIYSVCVQTCIYIYISVCIVRITNDCVHQNISVLNSSCTCNFV